MVAKSKRKNRQNPVDIPLGVVKNITNAFDSVYEGHKNVVIIGGRAVNLQCSTGTRWTHDIDLALPRKLEKADLERLPSRHRPVSGSYFQPTGEIGSNTKTKLLYHTPAMKTPVEIDLYYNFYSSRNGSARDNRAVGAAIPVPINAILDESEQVKVGGMNFTVPKIEVLMVMKYNTWLERGKGSKTDSKDMRDMVNMIRNHASDEISFATMMSNIGHFMDRYIPDKRNMAITGMLQNIPVVTINSRLEGAVSSLLTNNRHLLRLDEAEVEARKNSSHTN